VSLVLLIGVPVLVSLAQGSQSSPQVGSGPPSHPSRPTTTSSATSGPQGGAGASPSSSSASPASPQTAPTAALGTTGTTSAPPSTATTPQSPGGNRSPGVSALGASSTSASPVLRSSSVRAIPAPSVASATSTRAQRGSAPPLPGASSGSQPGEGQRLSVVSTAYSYGCGGGWITASGAAVSVGIVAMNELPLGTVVRIVSGPFAGAVETVMDRIGWGSELDFWLPSCWEARQYGRQWIEIEVVP